MVSTSTAQAWAQRLDRYEPLDTTIAQFCQAEGVSQAAYYYWRRKLRQTHLASTDRQRSLASDVRQTNSLAKFIPVALSASATPQPPS